MPSPDPAFLAFFDTEWRDMLHSVSIPSLPTASWDRKAAYLLWLALNGLPLPKPDSSAFD